MKTQKAIIFGVGGQDGFYLSEFLKSNNIYCLGVSRSSGDILGDIGDFTFVKNLIVEHQPNYVFHLAAISSTKHFTLFENQNSICNGTINILESTRLFNPEAKVFISGSALQFKNEGLPIDESTPFDASSSYSVSRINSIYFARYFKQTFNLKVYVGYFFNHDSVLRSVNHVNQKIIQAVKRINAGSNEKLEIGNMDVKKEFNFAGDVIEAVWILINQENVFEVVIGSGQAFAIRNWVEYCFKKINKNWEEYIVINENFESDYDILVSNPALINSLGWKPKTSMEQLADLMLGDKIFNA